MPLTQDQLDHLGRRLREERDRVRDALARAGDSLADTPQDASGDLSKVRFHLADEGTDTIDQEIDASEVSRLTGELREIDEALERLYRAPARFGQDERTGEEIPFERLDVIPWARHRVDHSAGG